MDKKTRKAVLNYMRTVAAEHVEPHTGEVNSTLLAEDAAYHFEHPEWLDVSEHEVWDLSVDVAQEYEQG